MERVRDQATDVRPGRVVPNPTPARRLERSTQVRYFPVDGSTFLDGEYLIKGVAGRLLWSLLQQYEDEGRVEFTHREVRLDPSLELPEFRDNFENRLVLLKRRLDERGTPNRHREDGSGPVPPRHRHRGGTGIGREQGRLLSQSIPAGIHARLALD